MKTVNKGFTLIELLVVIAIIGILSSVVLASLTTARTKGQDAAVQQQMSSMRSQAELFYSSNSNSYGAATTACDGMFTSTGTGGLNPLRLGIISSGATAVGCTITTSPAAWAMSATLPSGGATFCVDSSGKAASTTRTGAVCN